MIESNSNVEPVEEVAPLSPIPHRILYVSSVFALIASLCCWVQVARVDTERDHLALRVEQIDTSAVSPKAQRELVRQHRVVRRQRADWARRRLGCFILTGLLGFGGLFAAGLHGLHSKMVWQERDPPADLDDI